MNIFSICQKHKNTSVHVHVQRNIRTNQSDRLSMFYSSSSLTCPFTISISATTADRGPQNKTFLPVLSEVKSGFPAGVRMVDKHLHLSNGKSLITPKHQVVLQTDASKNGWKAYCQGRSIGGQWSLQESTLHINVLELKALHLALLTYTKLFQLKAIHVQIDNMTGAALSYLIKIGGTHNKDMIDLAKDIWTLVLPEGITITAEYLPGVLNTKADWASRNFQDSSEWLLSQKVFQKICQHWGQPDMGLVCIKGVSPASSLYGMEARSSEQSNRCSTTKVVASLPLCIPSILLNGEGVSQSEGSVYNPSHTKLANTTLVRSNCSKCQ